MQITFTSIGDISIARIFYGEYITIGEQLGELSHGLQPTYGMTSDDMGFTGFSMTIKLGGKK